MYWLLNVISHHAKENEVNFALSLQLAELSLSCFQTSVPKHVKTSDAFAQVEKQVDLLKNGPKVFYFFVWYNFDYW